MIFPVNDYHCDQDANPGEQNTRRVGGELGPGLNVAASNDMSGASPLYCAWKLGFRQPVVAPFSPLPAMSTSTWPIPSAETPATAEQPHPQNAQSGPDSGTLEQAAASMFSSQPGGSTHAPIPLSDPKYMATSNRGVPMHLQPTGVPDSVYPPAQVHFYPAHPYQYEYHYRTPAHAAPFFTPPPHQDVPQLQPPVRIQPHPSSQHQHQAQRRQSDSFNSATSAQQSAPPNPTLTYDAFWSSHSQSAHSYRNVVYTLPGPTYQGQINGVYLTQPAVADASGQPISTPMTMAGLAGAPAHAPPSAHNF